MTPTLDGLPWALVLTSMVVAAAGCGGSAPSRAVGANTPVSQPKPVASRAPSDGEELRNLLIARAAALQTGDAAKLTGTSTGRRQRARDRRMAAAAKRMPLDGVEMTLRSTDITADRAVLRVVTSYGFDNVESRFVNRSRVTAVKTPQGWRVRSERASGAQAPWELGRYVARSSPHFLALAPRGLRVGGLMQDLEAGRGRMQHALPGVRPPRRLLVLVTRGGPDTRALTRDVRALDSLTAIAEAQVVLEGPARRVSSVTGQRILVVWRSYAGRSPDQRRMVIAHELTHAALVRKTSGRTPAWLVEGIAMYASGDQRAGDAGALLSGARLRDASQRAAAKRTLSLAALARPGAMRRLGSIPLAVAYSYSSAAAYAIAQRHGPSGLMRLYDGFNDPSIRGHGGRRLDDRVVRRTLHRSLRDVQADVDAFARAHAGG